MCLVSIYQLRKGLNILDLSSVFLSEDNSRSPQTHLICSQSPSHILRISLAYPSYLLLICPPFHHNSLLMSSFAPLISSSSSSNRHCISSSYLPHVLGFSLAHPPHLLLTDSETQRLRDSETHFYVWPSGRDHYSQAIMLRVLHPLAPPLSQANYRKHLQYRP